jgi:riboflavin kinase
MMLRGRVTGGIGDLARWMTVHADLYEAKIGVWLYPGSLNLELDRPRHVGIERIRLEPPEYGVGLSIVPCTIDRVDAFIVRTDKNDRGEGDHPPPILEVAAAVRQRDALGLENGDEVEVVIADQASG